MSDLNFIERLERITVVCGHYGSGKTNFSLNLAMDMAKKNSSKNHERTTEKQNND